MTHQREVIYDPHRFKILIWHRRARKTTTAITEIVRQALQYKGVYWHIFPTYTEAKDAVWRDPQMLFNIIPEQYVLKRNEQELIVYFRNGSIYQLKGADNPDSLRGAGPLGIVLDEFATMKRETWNTVEPILRANGGWCWFIGTPKGKNHLFEYYQRGRAGDSEWKSWLLRADHSGLITPEQLERSRLTSHSQAFFNQEWLCEFLEGEGSVFRNVRDIMTSTPKPPENGHIYVMGVDLAKVQDYTVISVYDRRTNAQVYQKRIQTIEWPFQKKWIKEISDHYNRALVVLDATGLGDPVADDLLRSGVPVEPIKITSQSKKELIEKLSMWIEQRKMKMLPLDDTAFEFDNFSYELGPTGVIRYGAIQGFHDDIVIAQALAVYSLQPLILSVQKIEPNDIQQAYYDRQKAYYGEDNENDLIEAEF